MLTHKLVLDEVEDDYFKLIALHCFIEEYRLAFLLNKHLQLKLARTRKDLDLIFNGVHVQFPLYQYEDVSKQCRFYLVSNRAYIEGGKGVEAVGLFDKEHWDAKPYNLLPEFQNVDFFIKIEEEGNSISDRVILETLKNIPQLSTAYIVDNEKIKSKDNLIFD